MSNGGERVPSLCCALCEVEVRSVQMKVIVEQYEGLKMLESLTGLPIVKSSTSITEEVRLPELRDHEVRDVLVMTSFDWKQ